MKKDYMPVAGLDHPGDDAKHIEQHFTEAWDHRTTDFDPRQVEGQEEFKTLNELLHRLPPGARVFDGGCGLGLWTRYLALKGYDAVGMDISAKTIARLKAACPDANFIEGDIRSTGLPGDSFDLYFSWGTFEHFEDGFESVFGEARRILKPNGYLVVTVPFNNRRHQRRDRRPLWEWDDQFDKDSGYDSAMRFYQWRLSRPELQREMEINGFRAVSIAPIGKIHGFSRALRHDWHINPDGLPGKILCVLLHRWIPGHSIAHMLIGVARKPSH